MVMNLDIYLCRELISVVNRGSAYIFDAAPKNLYYNREKLLKNGLLKIAYVDEGIGKIIVPTFEGLFYCFVIIKGKKWRK